MGWGGRLMVTQVLQVTCHCILFCGCEIRTLLTDSEKRIKAFETECLRKFLLISYLEQETSDWMQSKISFVVDTEVPFLAPPVKTRKLAWFGHVTRYDSIFEIILQGTLQYGRRRGRQRKC